MTDIVIKIVVTRERFLEVVSIEDSLNTGELSDQEVYDYLRQFVVGEDGKYLDDADARKLFKKVPRKELGKYWVEFWKAVQDAFVNPTSGGDSADQS